MIRIAQSIKLGLIIVLAVACKRDEFMPDPVGEQIPHEEEQLESMNEVIMSSSNSLFSKLWQRSVVKDKISEGNVNYTVLLPSDHALKEGGWDEKRIAEADQATVDSLVGIHCFLNAIGTEDLENRSDTYLAETLFEKAGLRYRVNTNAPISYRFRVGLGLENGVLKVNAIEMGPTSVKEIKEGRLWNVNRLVAVPQRTAWEAIKNDSRFSLYVALIEYTDALYKETFRQANGYYPADAVIAAAKAFDRNSPSYFDMIILEDAGTKMKYVNSFNTWFIPTDEAFKSAGYHSLADLISFNDSRGGLKTNLVSNGATSYYAVQGEFATDSLLDYHHNWGRKIDNFTATRNRNASLFYPADLVQGVLGNYPIAVSTTIVNHLIFPLTDHTVTTYLYVPFDFPEKSVLQLKSNANSRAQVSGESINTLNGIVHGVDRLLKPKKFEN